MGVKTEKNPAKEIEVTGAIAGVGSFAWTGKLRNSVSTIPFIGRADYHPNGFDIPKVPTIEEMEASVSTSFNPNDLGNQISGAISGCDV